MSFALLKISRLNTACHPAKSLLVTLGRVLDTVKVSANHHIKNETAGGKDPVMVGKK